MSATASDVTSQLAGTSNDPLADSSGLPDIGANVPSDSSILSDVGNTAASINPTITPPSSTPSAGQDLSSLVSSITGLSSGTAGALTSAIPYAGVYALGQSAASSAMANNAATVAPLATEGNTLVGAGNQQLQNFNTGTINPSQKNVASTATAQGQTLLNAATPFGQVANTLLQQYQSGALMPADQQALDQSVTQQKQQVAQQMAAAGITDSSALDSAYQNIDNQALITRQNYLNSYLSTADTQYNTWLNSTTQGQQLQLEAQTYVANAVQQNLTNALALDQPGMNALSQEITATLASDTSISNQMTQLMASLAAAWAYQQAGGSKGTAGTTGATTNGLQQATSSGINSLIGKGVSSLYNNLTSTAAPAADATAGLGAAYGTGALETTGYQTANDAANTLGVGWDTGSTATDIAGGVASDATDVTNFSSAAAPAGSAATQAGTQVASNVAPAASTGASLASNLSGAVAGAGVALGMAEDLSTMGDPVVNTQPGVGVGGEGLYDTTGLNGGALETPINSNLGMIENYVSPTGQSEQIGYGVIEDAYQVLQNPSLVQGDPTAVLPATASANWGGPAPEVGSINAIANPQTYIGAQGQMQTTYEDAGGQQGTGLSYDQFVSALDPDMQALMSSITAYSGDAGIEAMGGVALAVLA